MTTIAKTVARLKDSLPDLIAPRIIKPLLAGLTQKRRQRILTPILIVQLMVLRVLHGNTAYSHLPHLAGVAFTPSAFCQALGRLPLELLESLLALVGATVDQVAPGAAQLFAGHRVLLTDAMCVSMPDTQSLRERFGYPAGQKPGLGFPIAKLLLLLDTSTGLIRRVLINPYRTHDASKASCLHPDLHAGDILLGDRAYCSFAHLALLMKQACHGLFRAHQRVVWNFKRELKNAGLQGRIIRSLGRCDRLIVYRKPPQRPEWMSEEIYAGLPGEITVRELKYQVRERGFRSRWIMLVTTLVDPDKYTHAELARLYGIRWTIETQFRHLKCTLKMAELKGKTPAVIEREILAYVLVYNLVSQEMQRVAKERHVEPAQISFIDTARWMMAGMQSEAPIMINPKRARRFEPRVCKRRTVSYPYMTQPRAILREQLLTEPKRRGA